MKYLFFGRSRSGIGVGVGVDIFGPESESESLTIHRLSSPASKPSLVDKKKVFDRSQCAIKHLLHQGELL